MRAMGKRFLFGIAGALGLQSAVAATTLEYAAPEFLDGPVVANSLLGTTYAYRAREAFEPTSLQITVVNIIAIID